MKWEDHLCLVIVRQWLQNLANGPTQKIQSNVESVFPLPFESFIQQQLDIQCVGLLASATQS